MTVADYGLAPSARLASCDGMLFQAMRGMKIVGCENKVSLWTRQDDTLCHRNKQFDVQRS
jgi:hypothetical protein